MKLEGQFIDRYLLKKLLGRGGMGEVYLAEDTTIHRLIAIKVLREEISTYLNSIAEERAAELSQREMRAISQLDHPHILPLFDYGEKEIDGEALAYMVMPYREEGSLARWQRQRDEPLSPEEMAYFVQQAADALQHAHEHGIVHQDVKPSNFLIRTRPNHPTQPDLLLADFGIAKFISGTTNTSQNVRGTPAYMAPEQWQGRPGPATDQYALAIMAYELIVGRPPFEGGLGQIMYQHLQATPRPPSSLNLQISAAIDAVLLRALAKKPEERFPTITTFAQALSQAAQGHDPLPLSDIDTLTVPPDQEEPATVVSVYDAPTLTSSHHKTPTTKTWTSPYDTQPTPTVKTTSASPDVTESQAVAIPAEVAPAELAVIALEDRHRTRLWRKIVLLGALACVLVLTSSLSLFAFAKRDSNRPQTNQTTNMASTMQAINAEATSQAYDNETNVARVNATGTAQANAAATTQANANATATAQTNAQGTVQANANATATAQANAQATAQANANATATAQATPPQLVINPTSLSVRAGTSNAQCTYTKSLFSGYSAWNCPLTLSNQGHRDLSWTYTTSTASVGGTPSFTVLLQAPASGGGPSVSPANGTIPAQGSQPVIITVYDSQNGAACPASTFSITFTGPANAVTVHWSCR